MNNMEQLNLWEYLNNAPCEDAVLRSIIEGQKSNVSSKRSLCKVKSLCDLLTLLRKRDATDAENLHKILRCVHPTNHQQIIKQLKLYSESSHTVPEYENTPVNRRPNPRRYHQRNPHLDQVYDIICENMGPKHWREMARLLDIPEGEIDQLGTQPIHSAIKAILYQHEEKCNPINWSELLLKSLYNANRKDLHQKVSKKLNEYGIVRPY